MSRFADRGNNLTVVTSKYNINVCDTRDRMIRIHYNIYYVITCVNMHNALLILKVGSLILLTMADIASGLALSSQFSCAGPIDQANVQEKIYKYEIEDRPP